MQSYGCDQKGRRLSRETGVEEVGFEVFPEGCDRADISYVEGEGIPKNRGIVTERIRKVFISFMNSTVKSGGMKELKFGGAAYCFSGKGVGVN